MPLHCSPNPWYNTWAIVVRCCKTPQHSRRSFGRRRRCTYRIRTVHRRPLSRVHSGRTIRCWRGRGQRTAFSCDSTYVLLCKGIQLACPACGIQALMQCEEDRDWNDRYKSGNGQVRFVLRTIVSRPDASLKLYVKRSLLASFRAQGVCEVS